MALQLHITRLKMQGINPALLQGRKMFVYDVIGQISAQTNDQCTFFTFVLYKIIRVFPAHLIHCIAAYPVDNAIRPLNNWGLVLNYEHSQHASALNFINYRECFLEHFMN